MAFDFKRLDIYRKVPKDLTQPTKTGAIISICSCLFISYLFFNELLVFLKTDIVSELFVDNPRSESRIPVALDVTLPHMKCEYIGLDIQDEMGRHEVGFVDAEKTPINDNSGCHFRAKFNINKVPGNFHLSTHSADTQPSSPDMRHEINSLTFGDDVSDIETPGSFNSLKGQKMSGSSHLASHDYILKIVPTIHETDESDKYYYYQYTFAHKEYTSFQHNGIVMPVIFFRYDLNPITVKYMERSQPVYAFLTSICAIIGGTFTVAGIIDALIFSASELYKKFELGKLS